jgi:hypothetical protein
MEYRHLSGIRAQAKFSNDGKFRYSLSLNDLRKEPGKTVCVIMQNPSSAGEEQADKSVHFLENLIFNKGLPEFQGVHRCIVVNQFARIQTRGFKGEESDMGPENDRHLQAAIQASELILIAWGKRNQYKDRQECILEIIKKTEGKRILITRKHPSRGRYEDFVLPFQI